MNKKFALEISFSFVTLSDENTNIPISGKEGDPRGSPRTRAEGCVDYADHVAKMDGDEVIAPNSVISEGERRARVCREIRNGAWFACGNRPC